MYYTTKKLSISGTLTHSIRFIILQPFYMFEKIISSNGLFPGFSSALESVAENRRTAASRRWFQQLEGATTVGKSVEVSQKTKNIVPDSLASPLLGTYPKKTETQTKKDTRTPVFTAALFPIARIWK